ncbi:hypothetical protein QTP88_000463 [Uroleucon formosanum]
MDKTPLFTTSVPTFNFDKPLFVNTTPADMVVDDSTITDNTNESSYSNLSVSTPAPADSNVIKNSLRLNQQSLPSDYIGPIFILVESINTEINLGKWHPVKAAKFFSTNFTGITNIKPAGFKKVKITFDSIENGNMCLKSAFLSDHGFSASIPSNLIYSLVLSNSTSTSPKTISVKAYLLYFQSKASDVSQSIRMALGQLDFNMQFLWVPSHVGFRGNEYANSLAKSSSNFISPSFSLIPWSDFTPLLRHHIFNLWSAYWHNLPANFASKYKSIVPNIINNIWFRNIVIVALIMSSSSGGDLRAGKSTAPSKIKTHIISHRVSDSDFVVATSKKNTRKLNKSTNTTHSPTSPGLQQIMDKTPLFTTSVPTFNFDKPLFVNTTPADMVVDDSTITDNTNESSYSNLSVSTPAPADSNVIKNSLRLNQQSLPSDYIGPIFILVESINTEINLGKWHPVKAAKFFSTNFTGITNIKPAGFKKVKITFDSIENGNMCLKSAFLSDHGFSASIPSNLIYSLVLSNSTSTSPKTISVKAYLLYFQSKASDVSQSIRMALLLLLAWSN